MFCGGYAWVRHVLSFLPQVGYVVYTHFDGLAFTATGRLQVENLVKYVPAEGA